MHRNFTSSDSARRRLIIALCAGGALLSACEGGNGDDPPDEQNEAVDFTDWGWEECPMNSPEIPFDSTFPTIEGSYEMTFEQEWCGVAGVELTSGKVYTLNVSASPAQFSFEHDDGTITITAADKATRACMGDVGGGWEIGDSSVYSRFVVLFDEPDLFIFGGCMAEFVDP